MAKNGETRYWDTRTSDTRGGTGRNLKSGSSSDGSDGSGGSNRCCDNCKTNCAQ
jgi:hypothetical protein